MKRNRATTAGRGGLCPQTPGIFRFAAQMAAQEKPGRPQPPRATSATESALGLRPRRALSSAQLPAEWITSTSPYNVFAANGAYQLMLAGRTAQMVRLRVRRSDPYIPEISANKYALNIRFTAPDGDLRPRQAEVDVSFELTFCSL